MKKLTYKIGKRKKKFVSECECMCVYVCVCVWGGGGATLFRTTSLEKKLDTSCLDFPVGIKRLF